MSREHAPAVKELAEKLLTLILPEPLRTSPPDQIADTLNDMADEIAEALDPFIKKVTVVKQVLTGTEGYLFGAQAMADELARWEPRWEPPKMEGK